MIKSYYINIVFFLGIITLFLVTRLYQIDTNPPAIYWDEASIGYNAYSVLVSGKDEWGKFFPLHIRAFGEFKLPVYIYSVVPFIQIFGLEALAVRLPAVFFSLGIVILTFLLSRKITGKESIGLISSFLLVIAPWFFIFSRTGFEATAGLMFYLLGVYSVLKAKENQLFIIISGISFFFSIYSYNSFRIIVPPTLLVLVVFLTREKIYLSKKNLVISLIMGMLLFLSFIPIYRLLTTETGGSRFQAIGVSALTQIPKNYLSYFGMDFLFLKGDPNLRHTVPGFGEIYLFALPFLLLGIYYIFLKRKFVFFIPLILYLLAAFPASITKEQSQSLRSLAMVPFLCIITAFGVDHFLNFFKHLKYKLIFTSIILLFLLIFIKFFSTFLLSYPIQASSDWQYPYKVIFTDYENEFPNYEDIFISDEYGQPYIFGLFYLKVDPDKFRSEVKFTPINDWGHSTVESFSNFKFTKLDKDFLLPERYLIFATPKEIEINKKFQNLEKKSIIKDMSGKGVFYVYSN